MEEKHKVGERGGGSKKGIFTLGYTPEVAVAMVTTTERLSTTGSEAMGGSGQRGSVPCEPIAALCWALTHFPHAEPRH